MSSKSRPVRGVEGRGSPSVARSLSISEQRDLVALAKSIPSTWAVVVEPPYGQLAITPLAERKRFHRCWVASVAAGRIYHDDGLSHAR